MFLVLQGLSYFVSNKTRTVAPMYQAIYVYFLMFFSPHQLRCTALQRRMLKINHIVLTRMIPTRIWVRTGFTNHCHPSSTYRQIPVDLGRDDPRGV